MPIETDYSVNSLYGTEGSFESTKKQTGSQNSDFASLLEERDTLQEKAVVEEEQSFAAHSVSTVNSQVQLESNAAAIGQEDTSPQTDMSTQTQKNEAEKNASHDISLDEKPCIAQFMVMTGCDFKTASAALYQYENWQDYLVGRDTSIPDLSEAQRQLQTERDNGSRPMVNGTYGARLDYQKPEPVEPEVPGRILPVFNEETGSLTGLGYIDAEGTQKTTSGLTDRETIYAHTDGFHIGRSALDQFAQLATDSEVSHFEDLDLGSLATSFPTMQEWITKNGQNAAWNTYTQQETADVQSSFDAKSLLQNEGIEEIASAAIESAYNPLYAQAQMNAMLFADL